MIPDTPSSAASGMGEYELASASVRPEPGSVERLVSEWRDAMSGVTPGPWYSESVDTEGSYGSGEDTTEGFKSYVVRTEAQKSYGDDAVVCDALNSGTAEVHEEFDEDGITAWDEPGRCTMAWIARCSPAGISTLLDALSAKDRELAEARAEIERLKRKLAEQVEATTFADENRTFQIERAEKAEAAARGLRRLLKINDDPPKPGFHCACAYHLQTAAQVEECGAHADLRARAEKAEHNWDIVLKSAKFWEETHYAQMTAISAAIGSTRFMDPPDGGDVSLADQVRRMRKALTTAERARDEALSALREKEERVKALEEALEPFVRLADSYFYRYETQPGVFRESHENDPDERAVYGINRVKITTGDFRRARSVLTPVSREQRGEEA